LAYINANFSFPSQSVTEFEKTANLLSETVKEVYNIEDKLNKTSGLIGSAVKQILLMSW
jgi:hypothetical protein